MDGPPALCHIDHLSWPTVHQDVRLRPMSPFGSRLAALTGELLLAVSLLSGCAADQPQQQAVPSIGVARMLADGTLTLQLRAEGGSAIGDALIQMKPDDPRYRDTLAHIGGLKPGEEKPVPPWATSEK